MLLGEERRGEEILDAVWKVRAMVVHHLRTMNLIEKGAMSLACRSNCQRCAATKLPSKVS